MWEDLSRNTVVEQDEFRKSQIQENIEAADKQRKDSELKLKEYDNIIFKSKLESKNLFNETREKTLKNINIKRDTLEKQKIGRAHV